MRLVDAWLLAAYPPSFRERYGDELAALVDDHDMAGTGTGSRPPVRRDLAAGAVRAWLRPTFAGPDRLRRRLLASVSTLWVCWVVVVCGTAGTLRLLEDGPAPGLDLRTPLWRAVHDTVATLLLLAGIAVVAAGTPLLWRVLRAGSHARRPLVLPAAVTAVVLAGFAALQSWAVAHGTGPAAERPPTWFLLAGAGWLLAAAVTSLGWLLAAPVALRRTALPAPPLRRSLRWGTAAAVVLPAPALLLVAVGTATGTAFGVAYAAVTWTCTATVCAAAVTGVVTTVRGLAAA